MIFIKLIIFFPSRFVQKLDLTISVTFHPHFRFQSKDTTTSPKKSIKNWAQNPGEEVAMFENLNLIYAI